MSPNPPQQLTASSVRTLYWALIAGLVAVMAVFASLFWLGTAPMLRGDPSGVAVIAPVMAGAAFASLAMGWLWARPNLPSRPASNAPASYWDDPSSGARALLLWVLWEGGSIIATVGSLLTGSLLTEAVAAIGLALLLTHGPSFLENRTG
jgi:hypothetical protein